MRLSGNLCDLIRHRAPPKITHPYWPRWSHPDYLARPPQIIWGGPPHSTSQKDPMFFEKCKKWVRKKLFTLLGHFGRSGAEWPENAREPIFGSRSALLKKMSKFGSGKNCLRFRDILGGQVQNDLKTLGNRFLERDLNFLENCQKSVRKQMFTLLGHFGGSGAEWPENAREPIFGPRSELFEKRKGANNLGEPLRRQLFGKIPPALWAQVV